MGNKPSSEETTSQRRISRPVVTPTAEDRKQQLRDISFSAPMTSRDRKRRRRQNEKSRERNRDERQQRKLGMEAKWSSGNRRYKASLLPEQREPRQSSVSERVTSDSCEVPTPVATTMVHDDEPDWAKDI
mmetsp:Transcript_9908/g.27745  ORF Transcript_9908/g.27745 Transcript_9908/m.27745 type:complete len:130 (+) Transcript_9908:119-508(+)|eukprot:CAMPEP_0197719554 /NCGR_PEP_ID=MMETSP1434-20131217/3264_1 /TAXON_ID=265543 /ORGANISM="Minutocellus polymorphus, Strain CCMP3303" /LENGTH=129 /DNA_ID=CAMNT_0043304311 /DNA_START=57 /DNA_END=446 /DNA_ORIENTATION=-